MKAAVYHGRHDIRIQSVPEPDDPGPGEVVLEVVRAAICGTDSSEWAHGPLLTRPPVTLGHEFVGRVVSIGEGVDGLAHGDRVVIGVGGIGSFILGAAAAKGVSPLIAVDIDDQRLRTARRLGAESVIDARSQDVAAAIVEVTGGDGAHVVIESSGAPGSPETAI